MASRTYPIRVVDGGRLITNASGENIAANNWTRKLNMRRVTKDEEGRCEGWVKFVGSTEYVFDGSENVLQLAELIRPNGERCIVGASRSKLKRFNSGTGAWDDINGGLTFSSSGKRWQWCTINGYLILNNGVDLPVSFRVEDSAVTQIYELRQIGYARVGRICEYNGFLMVADITKIKADQLDVWMNGYGNYSTTGTTAKAADWTIVFPTDHQSLFNVTTGASTITVTLPTLAFSNRPIFFRITKVDAGAGTVITSPVIADEPVILDANTDSALVWWNGTRWVAKNFALGVVPSTDPYGTPPVAITERYPWAVANSEFGEPTHWAPAFQILMPAAGTTLNFPFPPVTYTAKLTRLGVLNAGTGGTVLGGQIGYEDGILITSIGSFSAATMGVPVVIELTTNTALTYPRLVTATRFTDISTIVAEYRLVADSSEIVAMMPMADQLILYRTTSIWIGRFTGRADKPFIWTPKFPNRKESLNLPLWGDAIADFNGEAHIYPGIGGRFYQFDGISWPTIHAVCDDARALFFNGVLASDEVFVTANPYTKSIYFCSPLRTFAFDLEFRTVGEIDAVFGAGAFVTKPGASDRWMILAIGKNIFTYGLVTNAATNILTFLRDGVVPASPILKSGLISGGDFSNEKDLFAYTPVMSSNSPDVEIEVQLYSTWNPSATPVALLVPAQVLPTPAGECFFTTAFTAMFFQDQITLTDTRDLDFRISQRILELDSIGTGGGVPRRVTA